MTSERARPLLAFAAITVLCALVIAANMLRHPTATATAVEASRLVQGGPRVEFGTELASRPVEEAPPTGNVLTVALRAPVMAAPAGTRQADVRAALHDRSARAGHLRHRATVRHHAAPRHHATRPQPTRTPSAPVHVPSTTPPPLTSPSVPAHGQGHGRGHGPERGHGLATRSQDTPRTHAHGHGVGRNTPARDQASGPRSSTGPSYAAASVHQNGHRYGHGNADTSSSGHGRGGHGGGQGGGHGGGHGGGPGGDHGHGGPGGGRGGPGGPGGHGHH